MELKRFDIHELEGKYAVYGRVPARLPEAGLPLFWNGSAVEFVTTANDLDLEVDCRYDSAEGYLRVEANGATMLRFPLERGVHVYTILRNTGGVKLALRVYRETQPMGTAIAVSAVLCDGELLPVAKKTRCIEVLGDSVTAGEGLCGPKEMMSWAPGVFSSQGLYGVECAKALDARWSMVAMGGWGVYCAYNNDIRNNIPAIYDRVCGSARDEGNRALGSLEKYNFDDHPDVTVVNLGANDRGAFSNPAWVDAEGVSHKQRLDADGRPLCEDVKKVQDAAKRFLTAIRTANPDTQIVWCFYGKTRALGEELVEAAEEWRNETGDRRLTIADLARTDDLEVGSRAHPGRGAHAHFAERLTEDIREAMGW